MVHLILIVGPHASIVVGQQFQAHADLIGSHLISLVHGLMGLTQRACEVLHMVSDLVGYHIGIGEGVSLDTELALHLGEEREVDIELLVA